jgi:hypothetical protein
MPVDARTWKTEGLHVVGEATDGRRSVKYSLSLIGAGDDPAPAARRALTEEIVAALNAHGGPHLTRAQRMVYEAAVDHQTLNGWPAAPADLKIATGYTLQWIDEVLDQLAELGVGSRPPKVEVRRTRPFTVTALEGAAN